MERQPRQPKPCLENEVPVNMELEAESRTRHVHIPDEIK